MMLKKEIIPEFTRGVIRYIIGWVFATIAFAGLSIFIGAMIYVLAREIIVNGDIIPALIILWLVSCGIGYWLLRPWMEDVE